MMIEDQPGDDWRGLQERVAAILNECGFQAEVGAQMQLARGAVEVDVRAIDPDAVPATLHLCECKRWRTNVPQAEVQTFRTIVADAGAHVGLFISSRGFQQGAFEVVRFTNIHLLDWAQFQEMFVERWCRRYWIPTVRDGADRLAGYIEMPGNDAVLRLQAGDAIEPAEGVGFLVHSLWGGAFRPADRGRVAPIAIAAAIFAERDRYLPYLPREVGEARTLRGLAEAILAFNNQWLRDTGRI